MSYIIEPERKIPVKDECDLCVVGGSCTGVFAAVRAARLGLSVVLVEKHNILGGTAVSGLVNIWHSLNDIHEREQVIAGLTYETLKRLAGRGVLVTSPEPTLAYNFNPFELAMVLDEYVKENKIKVRLHTGYAALVQERGEIKAVIIEDADGRGAIKAKFFIDATGDGRLARDVGIPSYTSAALQPPTACFFLKGDMKNIKLGEMIHEHGAEFGLDDDWGWSTTLEHDKDITMRADNHVFGLRLDSADDLTAAEIEGRRRADAFVKMLKKYGYDDYRMVGLCSHIGTRETVHYETKYKANTTALLRGEKYSAPILKGSYRVDIHHSEDNGITFKYLDGRSVTVWGKNTRIAQSNWREEEGLTDECASYYELPFDVLVPREVKNLIPVGRMLNADEGAFGALRVMVNLNQLGEAAGVTAYLAVSEEKSVGKIDGGAVSELLRKGGSAV